MSTNTDLNSSSPDVTPTQRNLAQLVIYLTAFVACTIAVCIGFTKGWVLGSVLLVTVVGILLPGVTIITKLSKRAGEWASLIGIVIAALGYILGLYGYFHPVDQLTLNTLQTFDVRSDAGSCKYDPQKSLLTCDVSVTPK